TANTKRNIHRSGCDRDRGGSGRDLELRVRLKQICAQRALDARYRNVTLAAVDLDIAIMRHADDVIDAEGKVQECLGKLFPQLFVAQFVVRPETDDAGTAGGLFGNKPRHFSKPCKVCLGGGLELDLRRDLDLVLIRPGYTDRTY